MKLAILYIAIVGIMLVWWLRCVNLVVLAYTVEHDGNWLARTYKKFIAGIFAAAQLSCRQCPAHGHATQRAE